MKLVLFDCDGTLVDSQAIICAAMDHAFAACALTAPGHAETLAIVGLSLPEAMVRLLPHGQAGEHARLVEAYRGAFFTLRQNPAHAEPMFQGVAESLACMAAREDMLLGVVTGKARRGLRAVLERTGLAPHFAVLQTADDAPSKPHPAMVLQAMAEVGADPEDTLVVGDTSFDMEMARAAGARGLGVAWGYHPVGELLEAGAERVVERFCDIEAAAEAILAPEGQPA